MTILRLIDRVDRAPAPLQAIAWGAVALAFVATDLISHAKGRGAER